MIQKSEREASEIREQYIFDHTFATFFSIIGLSIFGYVIGASFKMIFFGVLVLILQYAINVFIYRNTKNRGAEKK